LSSCRRQQVGSPKEEEKGKKEKLHQSALDPFQRPSHPRRVQEPKTHRRPSSCSLHRAALSCPGEARESKSPFFVESIIKFMAMDIDCSRRNRTPRPLSDAERSRLDEFVDSIHYSTRYSDNVYEYRHVQLPKAMLKAIPKEYHDTSKGTLKLLWEDEWRALGITQSLGWEHYEVHEPEPHILLFKRPLNYQPPQ
ncbi:hypothetical protein CP532_0832, partial [Ophiocordyceps camponoti-leonardi (nom. inval.)]